MSHQFTRRQVNWAILAGTVSLAGGGARLLRATTLFDFAIAGGFFHGLQAVRADLALGERWELRPEPVNRFDANAVAVHRKGGLKLGFIPRAANTPVARLLADGASVDAVIIERLDFSRALEIPDDLAFTGFTNGDPRIRLTVFGNAAAA